MDIVIMLENAMTFFFQACILHSGISEDHQKNFVNIFVHLLPQPGELILRQLCFLNVK